MKLFSPPSGCDRVLFPFPGIWRLQAIHHVYTSTDKDEKIIKPPSSRPKQAASLPAIKSANQKLLWHFEKPHKKSQLDKCAKAISVAVGVVLGPVKNAFIKGFSMQDQTRDDKQVLIRCGERLVLPVSRTEQNIPVGVLITDPYCMVRSCLNKISI